LLLAAQSRAEREALEKDAADAGVAWVRTETFDKPLVEAPMPELYDLIVIGAGRGLCRGDPSRAART